MKLISCESCGTVLDTDKINKPEMYTDNEEGYTINVNNALWIHRDYVPAIDCPCCKTKITYCSGEMS